MSMHEYSLIEAYAMAKLRSELLVRELQGYSRHEAAVAPLRAERRIPLMEQARRLAHRLVPGRGRVMTPVIARNGGER